MMRGCCCRCCNTWMNKSAGKSSKCTSSSLYCSRKRPTLIHQTCNKKNEKNEIRKTINEFEIAGNMILNSYFPLKYNVILKLNILSFTQTRASTRNYSFHAPSSSSPLFSVFPEAIFGCWKQVWFRNIHSYNVTSPENQMRLVFPKNTIVTRRNKRERKSRGAVACGEVKTRTLRPATGFRLF